MKILYFSTIIRFLSSIDELFHSIIKIASLFLAASPSPFTHPEIQISIWR
jgi:hypothetical protein